MKSLREAMQCQEAFIKNWVGDIPEEIIKLFAAIVEKAEKEAIFDINMTTQYGAGLLHLIVDSNQDQTKAMDILLAHGADINLTEVDRTPLHFAIDKFSMNNRRFNFVTYLIEKGADINKGSATGKTPLHHVVMFMDYGINHSCDLLVPLLEKGALVTKQDNDGTNAYEFLEEKIEENPENQKLKLCLAELKKYYKKEKEAAIKQALAFEKAFKEKWQDKSKPYSYLLPKIVSEAKNEGLFNVDWSGNVGLTLLHYAAAYGQTEVIQLLLDNGADVNKRTTKKDNYARKGYTPLHELTYYRSESLDKTSHDCILLLLQHNAKPTIPDEEGFTVLNAAISNKQHDGGALFNLLIEGLNNPYEKSKLAATQTGKYQVVSLLDICLFNTKKILSKAEIEDTEIKSQEKSAHL